MKPNDDALFYTCSLIEFIARQTHNQRGDVVDVLGNDVERIYRYQDVFHCEPIEKVAADFIERDHIATGTFDNISSCRYDVPDYWDIGEVFARLISDCYDKDHLFTGLREVYHSWLAKRILNFNSALYFQSREYLMDCYENGIAAA